jgi:Golgi apparatus protein 1
MREHKCVTDPKDPDRQLSLVNLLLCLEDRIKKGENVKDECRREMLVHRRMLMSDYALSPEIISDCKEEMMQHCPSLTTKGASGTIDQRGGRMIHCLLSAARKEKSFSAECLTTIKSLVRVVDPGNDIRADPLLETACRPVIDALCSRIKPGDSNIILCLLENMKNNRMTDECEDRLMEVAYFMARDWR